MNDKNGNINIPINSLMVFSKGRLFFLFITAMMLGIAFFFTGFLIGYHAGKTTLVTEIKSSLRRKRALAAETKRNLQWIDQDTGQNTVQGTTGQNRNNSSQNQANKKERYLVHIGLFSSIEYAMKAWAEVSDYAKLPEKEAIKEISINSSIFYQVRAGIFNNKYSAQKFSDMITIRTEQKLTPMIEKLSDIK